MKTHNVLLMTLGIVMAVSLLCVWFFPSVQDFMAGNSLWNGIKNFQRQFNADQLQSLDNLPANPTGTAAITVPYLTYTDADIEALRSYLNNGGTLLLADDYGFGNEVLLALGVPARFYGNPLLDPLFDYRNQAMVKVTDFTAPGNIQQVLLNHATALRDVPPEQVQAWTSAAAFVDVDGNGAQDTYDIKGPLPVAARVPYGKGTLILVSDPSIMINTMINRADNMAFVNSLIGSNKQVSMDVSHLSQTSLDTGKTQLARTRDTLSQPYAVLALFAVLFAGTMFWMARRGGNAVAEESQSR